MWRKALGSPQYSLGGSSFSVSLFTFFDISKTVKTQPNKRSEEIRPALSYKSSIASVRKQWIIGSFEDEDGVFGCRGVSRILRCHTRQNFQCWCRLPRKFKISFTRFGSLRLKWKMAFLELELICRPFITLRKCWNEQILYRCVCMCRYASLRALLRRTSRHSSPCC
jgi:hypothetical protein